MLSELKSGGLNDPLDNTAPRDMEDTPGNGSFSLRSREEQYAGAGIRRNYEWLISQMIKRIGPPPEGVVYPVWAWYKQNGKRKKTDLRGER